MADAGGPVLFVADLHLSSARPALARLFERFLAEVVPGAGALWILGDLFEYWLGDDDRSDPLVESVLAALHRAVQSGTPVNVLHGNRDFLLGEAAARRTGFRLAPDPVEIDLFGRRAVLSHGDALCTDDHRYQAYRRRIRNPLVKGVLRALPLSTRRRIAQSLRDRSESEKRVKTMTIMDVNAAAVSDLFRRHDVDLLIHGHTHRPAHHHLMVDGRPRDRWVLQDWHEHGGYLRADATGIEALPWTG